MGEKLRHELNAMVSATAFFGTWICALVLLKALVLAEYSVGFSGWSIVLVGALILGKVALVLEHVPLGTRVRSAPAWVDVLLRTALYAAGVFVVLLTEHGWRERHEHGGFVAAVIEGVRHAKIPHVLANTLVVSCALLAYNALTVVRRRLGAGGLVRLFLESPPADSGHRM